MGCTEGKPVAAGAWTTKGTGTSALHAPCAFHSSQRGRLPCGTAISRPGLTSFALFTPTSWNRSLIPWRIGGTKRCICVTIFKKKKLNLWSLPGIPLWKAFPLILNSEKFIKAFLNTRTVSGSGCLSYPQCVSLSLSLLQNYIALETKDQRHASQLRSRYPQGLALLRGAAVV